MITTDNTTLGKVSLWASIVGMVFPLILLILIALFHSPTSDYDLANALCGVLCISLELVALGCGFAAKSTATGKAGLLISSTVLVIVVVFVLWRMRANQVGVEPAIEARPE